MNLMQKVNKLVHEIVPTITDEEFFTSKRYVEYLRGIAVGAINTVYTREASNQGKAEFKRREKEARIRKLSISVVYSRDDKDLTAATNGHNMMLNAGNELVADQDSRLFRHLAVLGFLGHEQGHAFFTDFVAMKSWVNYLCNGQWWPEKPQDILSTNGIELTELLEDEGLRYAVVHMAKHLWNQIEDGHIEQKMIAMFPGLYAKGISTLNTTLFDKTDTMDVALAKPDSAPLLAVFSQMLLYAKFGDLKFGSYSGDLEDYIYDSMQYLDQARCEGDAKKRIMCANDMLVILSPLIKEFAEKYGHLYTPPQQQQAGQPGNAGGLTPQQIQGMQNIFNQLASGAGGSQIPDSSSKPVSSGSLDPNQVQQYGQNGQSSDKGPGGASGGQYSAPGPAKDLQRIMEDMARSQAEEQVEEERLEEMNKTASSIQGKGSGNIIVHRQTKVDDDYRDSYEAARKPIESVSRNLQKGIMQILKDRQQGGKMKYKPSGRRMDTSSLYRKDGLHFCVNKMPNDTPPLYLALLLDESGSMGGEGEKAALASAVCIEHFCRSLHIPHQICGYTTGNGVSIESYVEVDKADSKDCYRLMGIGAKSGTPTVRAMRYMLKCMEPRQEQVKLLIVVSDGGAGDNEVYDENANDSDITRLLRTAHQQNVKVIAAGIGSDREAVCEEFGKDIFLDISDLEQMPTKLCKIVKRLLPVQ